MSARKRASVRQPPQPHKHAAAGQPSYQQELLRWRFGHGDFEGPWCPRTGFPTDAEFVFTRLSEFDSRTWHEVESDATRNHAVDVVRLGPDAQKRIRSIKRLQHIETLFSLHFGSTERLWGVREGATFLILWWDPDHEVYPVQKKHT